MIVGTHLAGSNVLLPRATAALKKERPYLTVIVREASPEALLLELEAGRVDVIVGRLTVPSGEGMVRRKLYDESVELVVRATHALAGRADADLAELMDCPWILPGAEIALRREVEEFFTRHGFALPANRVETTSFLTSAGALIRSLEDTAAGVASQG